MSPTPNRHIRTRKKLPRWEWRQPASHKDQPLIEWWVEQVAIVITRRIGLRADRRGDQTTLFRMLALSLAGQSAETDAVSYTIHADAEDPDTVIVTSAGVNPDHTTSVVRIHREDADPEHRFIQYRLAAGWFGNLPGYEL